MKKEYIKPTLESVSLTSEEAITAPGFEEGTSNPPDGWE